MTDLVEVGPVAVVPLPMDGITIVRAEVSPDMARAWLADQMPNRSVKRANVARWARDMAHGDWLEPVQPLQFNESGRLIDGQNRLSAVVEFGAPVVMWIAVGVPTGFRRAIDLGRSRSAADVLMLENSSIAGNRNRVAAIARQVLSYTHSPEIAWTGSVSAWTVAEIVREVESDLDRYERAAHSARRAQQASASQKWLSGSPFGATRLLVERLSSCPDQWEDFEEGAVVGAGLSDGDPRLTLRNSNIPTSVTAGSWRQQACLMATIKVWNAWVKDESLQKIYASSPKYLPMPEVF